MPACPSCGHDNIEGVDQCEQCQADLYELGLPSQSGVGLGRGLLVDSILKLKPQMEAMVSPATPVAEVVRIMCDQHASGVMVVAGGELIGVFTERDFLMKIADRYDALAGEPIARFMTSDPECLEIGDSIAAGLNRMAVKNYRHIPILENGRPKVMVRTRDVLNYLAPYCQS